MPEELSLEDVLANSGEIKLPESANEAVAELEEKEVEEVEEAKEEVEETEEKEVEEAEEPAKPAKKTDLWDGVDISDEDKSFWNKKASIEARQKVASILRERKEAKPATPATSYYDNEKAYLLDPAFRDSINEIESAEWLENHWSNQLALAEDGEDVQGIRPVLNAKGEFTGRYEPGDKLKSDSRVKVAIQKQLYAAQNTRNTAESKADSIRSGYTKHATEIKSKIETARKETFGHWQDPKNSEARKMVEDHVKKSLGVDNGNPVFPILVDAIAELFHQLQANKAGKTLPKPEPKPKSEGLTKTRDTKDVADRWAKALAEGDESFLKG